MRLGKDVLEADLYAVLGILPDATASEIRVAYRRRARESHPDLNQLDPQAVPRMARLNVAAESCWTLRCASSTSKRVGIGQSRPPSPGRLAKPSGSNAASRVSTTTG